MLSDGWFSRFFEPQAGREAPRIGLALSCGGARGLAHVGVIQVLEEEQIPISTIIGSSMGAYVGSLWAAGISGKELEKLAAEIKDRRTLMRLMDPILPPLSGFMRGYKVRKHLERTLGETTLGELQIPTYVVATNLDTLNAEIMPADMPVAAAVHASCAIPGICAPVRLNNTRYIDGGAAEPLPVGLLRERANVDAVIAVNVMATADDIANSSLSSYPHPPVTPASFFGRFSRSINRNINLFAYGNLLDTFKRCLTSAQIRLIAKESLNADVLLHPFIIESRWYDYENFQRYIEAGRKAAQDAMPQIRALLMRNHNHMSNNDSSKPNHQQDHETVSLITPVGCGSA